MENSLLMILTALLLLGVQGISAQIPNITTTPSTPRPTSATASTNLQTTCSKMIEYVIKSDLFRLRVIWNRESACEGQLYVYSRERKGPLCADSHSSVSLWTEVCKDIRCGDFKGFKFTSSQIKGLMLSSNMTFVDTNKCNGLYIMCQVSQKRQNRWVGPTQSVSYHRGQGPPNKNTDKRLSFPGLERLTVNQSREPSSNRNSDYDSFGYS